jgi:DNA-binding SARP family transcriptional activator
MPHLSIILFGGFRVELDGKPLTDFGTEKNRALLAYLALEGDAPHRREALANLLWCEHPESVARNSLRQALFHLRHTLAQKSEIVPHLLVTANQVQFNPASDHWMDVAEFTRCLDAGGPENLERAAGLYQGDLLDGFTLPRCPEFTDWQVIQQETCHHQVLAALTRLADYYQENQDFEKLIACTRKKIELEPWRESAYRRQMWALAIIGQRERALLRYTTLQAILQQELGISPSEETRRLYEQIRDGDLPGSREMPGEQQVSSISVEGLTNADSAPFAGRRAELARLNNFLQAALAGQGRVAFVSGEAGSGKTALLHEFARRAMRTHDDLLVAYGTCSAYNGLGDSFQPFREMLGSLVGSAAAPFGDVNVSQAHARRLAAARPVLMRVLLEAGPGFVNALIPPQELPEQARKVEDLDIGKAAVSLRLDLHDQAARSLLAISQRFPLLILLDDLQWLDEASASLLFHLGGHIAGRRILLLGAYRPEDMVSASGSPRHPLAAARHEFQRRFGEITVDLSQADGHAFVEAYLDRQPNYFDRDFRETLYRHTGGNALYLAELVSAMGARGNVVQDEKGYWGLVAPVDWNVLPPRVEAVIAERLERQEPGCLQLLRAASIQGEVFTSGVLAWALGVAEEEITAHLSGSLCKQHLLVSSLGLVERNGKSQALYRFRCLLIQKFLYQGLDEVERQRLERVSQCGN